MADDTDDPDDPDDKPDPGPKIQCLHCLEVFPPGPEAEFMRLHIGPGEPHFADPGVVGAIVIHSQKHEPRAWIEGRDYVLLDTYTCPRCGRTSNNPNDIEQGYCGNCHDWTRDA